MFHRFRKPTIVSWNISYLCNLHCAHCYTDSGSDYSAPSITKVKHVIDILHESDVRTLCFGGGEPTILPHIIEIIDYALTLGLHVFLCSNGYKIPASVMAKLPTGKPLAVSIGIDGGTPDTYSKIRGPTDGFLESLATIAKLSLKGIYTIVDFTATQVNWKEFPQVISNAASVGACQVNLKRFIPIGRGAVNRDYLEITPVQQRTLLETWVEEREKYTNVVVEAQDPLANTLAVEPSIERGLMIGRCMLGLTPTLDILPSPTMPIILGNLLETDISEVWRESKLLADLSDSVNLEGYCRSCKYGSICGGHREHAYARCGSPFSPDPLCWRLQD